MLLVLLAVSARANWAWMGGSTSFDTYADHGALGIEASGTTPGSIENHATVLAGDYMYVFGGFQEYPINILWRYNIKTQMWTWMAGNNSGFYEQNNGVRGVFGHDVVPAGRQGTVAFIDMILNSLFVFGGSMFGDQILDNNLFEFSFVANQWRWIHGSGQTNSSGYYGQKNIPSALNSPPARFGAAYFYDRILRKAFVYGGLFVRSYALGDHWMYDVSNSTWTWIHGLSEFDREGYYGTTGIGTELTRPGARCGAAYAYDERRRKFYFYGGSGSSSVASSGYPTDLWLYEPDRNIWTFISGNRNSESMGNYGTKGVTEAGTFPRSRTTGFMVIDEVTQKIYLFGGVTFVQGIFRFLNDVWTYDLDSQLWTWVGGSNLFNPQGRYGLLGTYSANFNPPGRGYHTMVFHNASKQIVMFGGRFQNGVLADVWFWDTAVSSSTTSTSSRPVTAVSSTNTDLIRGKARIGEITSNQTALVIATVAATCFFALFAILLVLYLRSGRFLRPERFSESTSKASMLGESSFPSSSMSAFTENKGYNLDMTIFSTTRGLALPAHLMVNLDDFRCDELIASGGGADVYKGEVLRANLSDRSRIIVVKKPKITNNFGVRMFEQEVCIMSLLGRSKYVAKLVGYSAEPPCMLLQMYEFGSVYSFTKKQKLTRKWKVRFSLDISKGISDIHCSHIAHCDIKPQNILVERDRKKWRCVITDFGIAQVLSQDLMIVKSMQYVSTRGLSVQYAAPEIFIRFRRMMNDDARVMKAGDVYSFGIVLYFLITRKQPWYYS